jgi:vitamin B12/bleomycin/antimicrobial peptide transport system ATP-binding/permease protein
MQQIKRPEQPHGDKLEAEHLVGRFLNCAIGFWGRSGTWLSWFLSGTLLFIIVLNLATSYGMNVWTREIFDALQKMDSHQILFLSIVYPLLLAVSIFIGVMQVQTRMTVQRRWREWLTNELIDRWFKDGRYYQLNLVSGAPGNPECRLADDVRIATESPVDLVFGLITAVLSAATFVVVLWNIGGALTVHISGMVMTIPGFLVVAAVIQALVASGAMLLVGRRLIIVSEHRNQAEAEYRYVLTRIRENGESIALLQGEHEERNGIDRSFRTVLSAWRNICSETVRTTIVSQSSGYLAGVLPIILCAPKFLDGGMTLGEVMQAASAFTIVLGAFNWLVDNYPRLADWTASTCRIASLQISLDELEHAEVQRVSRTYTKANGPALRLQQLSITLEDRSLITAPDVTIMPGERVMVIGESGSGKTALVRALAGLWPWGKGHIELAAEAKLFFLPQRAYLPSGTLRRGANYPDAPDSRSTEEIAKVLDKVRLSHLVEHLDEERPWDQMLSAGEKQRLAFARLFIHRPDIIVLDEATGALDLESECELMELLSKELERATIVSIGHRSNLEAFQSRKFVIQRGRGGAKLVSDIYFIPRAVSPNGRASMEPLPGWNGSLALLTRPTPASIM